MKTRPDQSAYPQKRPEVPSGLDKLSWSLRGRAARALKPRMGSLRRFARRVEAEAQTFRDLDEKELRSQARGLGQDMRRQGFLDALLVRSFAAAREAATRHLGMTPYPVQLMGGLVLLQGRVAEMATGEGKTLTATLPASAAALAGIPVHIVSVNDYLTGRDADWMTPVYQALGLTVGKVLHGMPPEQRREAYGCDITFVTNKELVFDYLRDRLTLGPQSRRPQLVAEKLYHRDPRLKRLLLRGLHFAIVDEADSIFIDEARTPVILSSAPREVLDAHLYVEASNLADSLRAGSDYRLDPRQKTLELTADGQNRLDLLCQPLGPFWSGPRRREELVVDALMARHFFEKDKQYLLQEGRVAMIDEYTGRVMPDRTWSLGLHQAIEAKEGVTITGPPETLAQISYQQFFRRYLRLSGMTGTSLEVSRELWQVYGLTVVPIPTNQPVRRTYLPHRVFADAEAKWTAIVKHVARLRDAGRPVLIGTRSVSTSEDLSRRLTEAGLEHRVLNARQDRDEAEIIAQAGGRSRITVATNMAGRGTDIVLEEGVADLGGLHVVATERHEAGRIDRQLFGRCARQGDPGSCILMLSFDDELVTRFCPRLFQFTVPRLAARVRGRLQHGLELLAGGLAQRASERVHRRMRAQVLKIDEYLRSTLSFAGPGE